MVTHLCIIFNHFYRGAEVFFGLDGITKTFLPPHPKARAELRHAALLQSQAGHPGQRIKSLHTTTLFVQSLRRNKQKDHTTDAVSVAWSLTDQGKYPPPAGGAPKEVHSKTDMPVACRSFVLALPIFPARASILRRQAELLSRCIAKPTCQWHVGRLCWHYLFSRPVTRQVSSAHVSLTSVFGMGTGGPSPQSTPTGLEGLPLHLCQSSVEL